MTDNVSQSTQIEYEHILVDYPKKHVCRVTLNRPESSNAQGKKMLYEIDAALAYAAQNENIKVIIIAANGENFSSGHDLFDQEKLSKFNTVSMWFGFEEPGQQGQFNSEQEMYLGLCWRWRNLPKPTIVQVQGVCMAGGLMLVWPFDIVIASEEAIFADPTVAFGVNGHEYFTHAWELGPRKAKELLFCGEHFTAEECKQLGMVNHVVELGQLSEFSLNMAESIAKRPLNGLRMAKLSVNASLDAQGQWNALQSAFGYHQLSHANARLNHGYPADPSGIDLVKASVKRR